MDMSFIASGVEIARIVKDAAGLFPVGSDAKERLLLASERVAFWQEQIAQIAKRNEELEKELSEVKAERHKLQQQVSHNAAKAEFEEARGALFKRKAGGGYVEVVYCPECRVSTYAVDSSMPFLCPRCYWKAPFKPGDLKQVIAELPD